MSGNRFNKLNRSLDDLIDDRGHAGKSPRSSRGQTSNPRHNPYEKDQNYGRRSDQPRISESLPDLNTPPNSIKVAATMEAKEVAAKIIEACQFGDPPALLTIGNNSINQAVKAIAIARSHLNKEDWDLSFQPAFRHTDRTKPLIAFYLCKERLTHNDGAEEVDLSVAGHSKIVTIAGAIAGKTRENKRVALMAIGVDAVTNAVLAVGNARLFLEQNNLDIKVQPAFEKIPKNGTTYNVLKFCIVAENV